MAAAKTRITRIGNSHGIRIPKPVLDSLELEMGQEVSLSVHRGTLVIGPARRPREGWAESFKKMAERGDDTLLDAGAPGSTWDGTEWTW